MRFSVEQLREAARLVHSVMPPTPQYAWPLLAARCGCEVWVKHENHTPIGAFKVRGGIVYADRLRRERPAVRGFASATRGNHGQSLALAARRSGLQALIVVPRGNSVEKNAAMRSLGAELIEHGEDFEAARLHALDLAQERGLEMVPPFAPDLVLGVASYGLELFDACPDLHTVYAPVGMGSGLCGLMQARDALGLGTRLVGVVAAGAPSYALSFAAGKVVETELAQTMADGVACRRPSEEALELMLRGVERVLTVTDQEIGAAIRHYHSDTHNCAEGAGAAPLAALLQERERMQGKKVGLILSGGNIDRHDYARILAAE